MRRSGTRRPLGSISRANHSLHETESCGSPGCKIIAQRNCSPLPYLALAFCFQKNRHKRKVLKKADLSRSPMHYILEIITENRLLVNRKEERFGGKSVDTYSDFLVINLLYLRFSNSPERPSSNSFTRNRK